MILLKWYLFVLYSIYWIKYILKSNEGIKIWDKNLDLVL